MPSGRTTAATTAIVVGVLSVIAGIVVTLVVLSGGDGDEGATDRGAGVTSSAPPTAPVPAGGAVTEGTDAPEGSDSSAGVIRGDGYSYELPGTGWQDALEDARSSGLGATLDSIIILGSSLDLAQSNILVEALTAGGAPDVDALEGRWKRNLSGTDGAVPDDLPDLIIDGERAIGVRFSDRKNVNGLLIDQVVYLTLHEGDQFSVALSLPSADDSVSEADFEKLLASWTWTD